MKYLLVLVLFSALVCNTFSAVFVEHLQEIPGHEKQCYNRNQTKFYKIGETMDWDVDKICGQKICESHKNSLYVTYSTCGKVGTSDPCRVETDLSLPYPGCCPKVICPDKITEKKVY